MKLVETREVPNGGNLGKVSETTIKAVGKCTSRIEALEPYHSRPLEQYSGYALQIYTFFTYFSNHDYLITLVSITEC